MNQFKYGKLSFVVEIDRYLTWLYSEGGQGVPPPPRIARLLVFAMLKFSVRPLLGIWTPPEKIFWICACFMSKTLITGRATTKKVFLLNNMQLLFIMLCLSCYMLFTYMYRIKSLNHRRFMHILIHQSL